MSTSFPKPFIIGVAGGTGSGKTTIAQNIFKALDPGTAIIVSHDDYYRDQSQLPMSEREKTNYDHPNSLETPLLVSHLKMLSSGQPIEKPTYDFVHHTRSSKIDIIHPTKVIILEGILIFENEELRNLMNLKIYVDTDADIRFLRRIKRDMADRGRTFEFSSDQYVRFTRPMHYEFVEPNKRYADIIVPEGGENQVAIDLLLSRIHEITRK